jgi:hypothetical protein
VAGATRPEATVSGADCSRSKRVLQAPLEIDARYNHGHTSAMKTAISIPDAVFDEAETLAQRRGWSRSELYANALAAYLKDQRFLGVSERLDRVYATAPEDSLLAPDLAQAQAQVLRDAEW